jgi:nicotinate-nucleotide pyrophosphorylase (carboxylating)
MSTGESPDDSSIGRVVELALMEDIGLGDITGDAILDDADTGAAEFLCKGEGIVAGIDVAEIVFSCCDPGIRLHRLVQDGSPVTPGQVLARIDGNAKGILRGERTALNFLQRMSGIATLTGEFVRAVAGTGARITDTRKTAPGLRALDKMAVRLGGGVNHRFGLDDMVLIKDNHIVAAGGIAAAVTRSRTYLAEHRIDARIEVETKNLMEVDEALSCPGVGRIMLDNFDPGAMRLAVERIGRRVEVEASGGITLATVRACADTGVDFISVGALTHSVKALDISLELSQTARGRAH